MLRIIKEGVKPEDRPPVIYEEKCGVCHTIFEFTLDDPSVLFAERNDYFRVESTCPFCCVQFTHYFFPALPNTKRYVLWDNKQIPF